MVMVTAFDLLKTLSVVLRKIFNVLHCITYYIVLRCYRGVFLDSEIFTVQGCYDCIEAVVRQYSKEHFGGTVKACAEEQKIWFSLGVVKAVLGRSEGNKNECKGSINCANKA